MTLLSDTLRAVNSDRRYSKIFVTMKGKVKQEKPIRRIRKSWGRWFPERSMICTPTLVALARRSPCPTHVRSLGVTFHPTPPARHIDASRFCADEKNARLREHFFDSWRKGWDSNPRYGRTVNQISSLAHSTTLPPFLYPSRGRKPHKNTTHTRYPAIVRTRRGRKRRSPRL